MINKQKSGKKEIKTKKVKQVEKEELKRAE